MPLAITGARVWDGVAETAASRAATIRIEDGRIAAIGSDPALAAGAEVLPLPDGAVVVPGLIDAHVHVTLSPELRSPEEQGRVPPERLEPEMEARALAMLRAGITTARDLGGGEWREIGLRDRIVRGDVPGPRLLCAGQPLTSPGGHCHFWGGEVQGADAIRAAVERQVERGADWIKVMATGGVITRGSHPREAQFEVEDLARIVTEAARHRLPVAAHCHGTAGIRNATAAGVRTLEHCSFAGEKGFGSDFDPALPPRIAAQDTWVSPTINAGWRRFMEKDGEETRFLHDVRACLESLRRAGAPLIASTDAGIPNVRHHDLPRALPVFARFAGMRPVDALRAATSESARALGIDDHTGTLVAGMTADLLALASDPLADLSALERPLLVVARGVAYAPEPAQSSK